MATSNYLRPQLALLVAKKPPPSGCLLGSRIASESDRARNLETLLHACQAAPRAVMQIAPDGTQFATRIAAIYPEKANPLANGLLARALLNAPRHTLRKIPKSRSMKVEFYGPAHREENHDEAV